MLTLKKIPTIEDFFYDYPNLPWIPLPEHSLEQSPCFPVLKSWDEKGIIWYSCKVHPHIESVNLGSIEHHCKYHEPELHKARILEFLQELLAWSKNNSDSNK